MLKLNTIHNLHALEGLAKLPDESVDMVLTSPPYWNLRNYGKHTDVIWGGKQECKHTFGNQVAFKRGQGNSKKANVGNNKKGLSSFSYISRFCQKCGAWKGQLGLEPTVELFIDHLVELFDNVHRVLKKSGTCWVNLGDTYYGPSTKENTKFPSSPRKNKPISKCLSLIPFRFAQAMTSHGWILRNVIIWHKPNCMPSPAKDRFTVDFEYLFFFTKSKNYSFAQQLEPIKEDSLRRCKYPSRVHPDSPYRRQLDGVDRTRYCNPKGRNKRCVWNVPLTHSRLPHFAAYPMGLCETPIKAGCPKRLCKKCDKPKTKGCDCKAGFIPGIVLDPFIGSGTTAIAAKKLDRDYIGFELNPEYVKIAKRRIKQAA